MGNRRPALYVSIGVGIVLGLAIAWNLPPAGIVTEPGALKPDAKEQYLVLTAMAYSQDGDLERAGRRLASLGIADPRPTVAALAERYIGEPKSDAQRGGLARLAMALGADSVTLRLFAPTRVPSPMPEMATPAPSPTVTPTAVRTAIPTVRPIPTAISRTVFRLFEQARLTCDQEKTPRARILVYAQDVSGKGLPGVRIEVQWNDGQDAFFTGLKSADPGYGDFEMQPGKSYSVQVGNANSQVATGLETSQLQPDCPNDGKLHYRAWRLIFRRID